MAQLIDRFPWPLRAVPEVLWWLAVAVKDLVVYISLNVAELGWWWVVGYWLLFLALFDLGGWGWDQSNKALRGNDILVVWDDDDAATDIRLKAAFQAAKALAVRAGKHDEEEAASLLEMDAAIEAIRKQIAGFEEIQTTARTVVNGGEKIHNRARIMGEEIERRLLTLQDHARRLRSAGEGA